MKQQSAEHFSSSTTVSTTTRASSSSSCISTGGMTSEHLPSGNIIQDLQLFDDAYKPDLSNCTEEFELERWCFPEAKDLEFTEFDRMKVERQISASLYAINGVQEYMDTVHDPTEAFWDLPPFCSLFCQI
ncbi:hypothetical protein Patl1_22916 [Pistacia atlantica]|uniref:Uncharacterized protein n=1 Tax=Pistacia atlantica TaxID=434234 RepID=A0ACC0ZY62_9ROSI|nr:hypothetical protein Patl1_22916 [Pistacia atlantica]